MACVKGSPQNLCAFLQRESSQLSLLSNSSNYSFVTSFLSYLQADYNVIKRIDSGALRFLYKLRVLILNDNLIPNLPPHLFRLDSDYFTAELLNYARTDL